MVQYHVVQATKRTFCIKHCIEDIVLLRHIERVGYASASYPTGTKQPDASLTGGILNMVSVLRLLA